MQTVGFTGSRHGFPVAGVVPAVVRSVVAAGHSVAVGCARGADAAVRFACPGAQVFKVASPGAGNGAQSFRAALARRSQAMVSACNVLVGFASQSCPSGVSPSRCFRGGGSGTWASIAFAVKQGLQVFVFCAPGVCLPSWPGGGWVQAAPSGVWSSAFRWVPAVGTVGQLKLLAA